MAGGAGTVGPVSRVGPRIRALRVKRRLTQSALAKKAAISREYLTRLEAGRYDPKIGVVDRIAKVLKACCGSCAGRPGGDKPGP